MNSLDKQRVDVSYAQNTFSSTFNLKANNTCQTHTLTKDVYGREVGQFGIKRYDANCGDKNDSSQNLQNILKHENALRPTVFQNSPGAMSYNNARTEISPGYVGLDQISDMRLVKSDIETKSVMRDPIVYH